VCGSQRGSVISVVKWVGSRDSVGDSRSLLKRGRKEGFSKNGHPGTLNRKMEKPFVPEPCQTTVPLNCEVVEAANCAEQVCQ
jgi:hypothetical protein